MGPNLSCLCDRCRDGRSWIPGLMEVFGVATLFNVALSQGMGRPWALCSIEVYRALSGFLGRP